ncbi:DUF7604 domain-containing protein [Streptococcus phocae]|uniref:DUF7604 domain-containing protein n=1 Tax=Streptococcus phocae TaxID=119224 RepID=UPI0006BC0BAB|nr:SpaA isopeptide-forming pilin-related protein [Streptococcus phocae]
MKKIDYKLISLVATAGLIFSQLALPVAQVASMTEHVETHQNPSGQRASPSSADLAPKEPEKARSSPTVVSTKQTGDITVTLDAEKSAEGFEKATASLASLETSDATKRNDQDLDKLSQELKKQSLKITDAQIIDLTNLPASDNLGVTLTFKDGLALAGLTEKDKNLKIGILTNESDEVSVVDAEKVALAKEEGQAQKVTKLSYKGKVTQPSTRIIIARTTKLQEKTELDLEDYGKLVLDGTTEQEKTDQLSPYRKPVTIKVLQPKEDTIESTFESADFEEVETIKNLFVWQKEFTIIDYLSDDYKVVKTEYQKANTETFETKEMLYGNYEAVNHARDGKYSENVIKVYLRSSKPLDLAPMLPAKVARSFGSAQSGGEDGKTVKRSRFKRSLLQAPVPRSARNKRSVQPRSVEPEKKVDKGNIEHHKQIDYLGDSGDNKDTTVDDNPKDKEELEDLYRLYLDMTGTKEALDVLVVVDRSGSMKEPLGSDIKYEYQHYEMTQYGWDNKGVVNFNEFKGYSYYPNNTSIYYYKKRVNVDKSGARDRVVENALLGTSGLLQKFLDINSENRLAVIGFQGSVEYPKGIWQKTANGGFYQPLIEDSNDAEVLKEWGSSAYLEPHKLGARINNGTNYHAALLKASEMFKAVKNDDRRKIMIFISDGVPTFYFGENRYRHGNGSAADINNVIASQTGTNVAIDNFRKDNPQVTTYSLGVSKDINKETASSSPVVLRYLSGKDYYYGITKTGEIENTLSTIVENSKISELKISDNLSRYVDYYQKQPDVKVTRKLKTNDKVEVLYENKSVTEIGKEVIQEVKFDNIKTKTSSGKVTLVFHKNYRIDDKYTYTVSFNVKASDEAYEKYKNLEGKYDEQGNSGTDYLENNTSSGYDGLRSNDNATVDYMADGRQHNLPYKHPVIQVRTVPMTIEKVDAKDPTIKLDGVKFALYRENDKAKEKVWEKGTTKNGQLTFKYLQKDKTYDLYETQAKPGYALPQEPWKVMVDKKGKVTVTDQEGKEVEVKESNKQPVDKEKGNTFVLKNQKHFNLKILKRDGRDKEKGLTATFGLYDKDGKELVKNSKGEEHKLETQGKDHSLEFEGIKSGKYILKEEKAPENYYTIPEVTLTIDEKGKVTIDGKGKNFIELNNPTKDITQIEITVKNFKKGEYPKTGGMGRTVFTLVGVSVMAGALAMMLRRRAVRH